MSSEGLTSGSAQAHDYGDEQVVREAPDDILQVIRMLEHDDVGPAFLFLFPDGLK